MNIELYKLMALHEDFLHENILRLQDPSSFKSITLEEGLKKTEAMLAVGVDYQSGTYFVKNHPEVALIPIIGPTDKFGGWFSAGYMGMSAMLKKVKSADKYKAVLFYIDSPGGAVDGMADWSAEIMNCTLPTMAFIDGLGASGGIWQAVACDNVLANSMNENTIGSIGVQTMHIDRSAVLKTSVGNVTLLRAKQSTLKNKVNSFEPLSKEGEDRIVASLSVAAEKFINHIQSRRPSVKSNSDALKGEIYNGPDALAEGLIDGLATLDEAIDQLLAKTKTKSSNQSSTNNQSKMKFKSTLTAILAAIGFASVASEEESPLVTEERLVSLNASLETANSTISTHTAKISSLETDLANAKSALATAETDRDKYKADADKYGKQAGTAHNNPIKVKVEGGNQELSAYEANAAEIAALPHNRVLDSNPLFN